MSIFEKAKKEEAIGSTKPCAWCGKRFKPDKRNESRGWAKCCSKSCAVSLRNKLFNMPASEMMAEIRDMKLREIGL